MDYVVVAAVTANTWNLPCPVYPYSYTISVWNSVPVRILSYFSEKMMVQENSIELEKIMI